ncbi:hypothetical protein GALL_178300 [mine drainage metagenome]|uniref:DUF4397 domain-containing protein n=1 Tax=mine drainage metagenome TaxID=410659 RepID=A0A1J5S7Y5_9ZZZZ
MQLNNSKYSLLFFFFFVFASCAKHADNNSAPVVPPTGDTISAVKFFNVVDQGKLKIKVNGKIILDSLAQYYPSDYLTVNKDSNSLQILKPGIVDTPVVNINFEVMKGRKYSCYIYKIGFDWKVNFVKDDLTPPDSGYAGIRILDFRTQAQTDFVDVNLFSLGFITYSGVYPFIYRHFLDHTSFDFLTAFTRVFARPDYNIVVFNSNANLVSRSKINLASKKLYSIILMTPQEITSDTAAIRHIFPDVQQHN